MVFYILSVVDGKRATLAGIPVVLCSCACFWMTVEDSGRAAGALGVFITKLDEDFSRCCCPDAPEEHGIGSTE